jgi:TolB-like protein/Tfp pilus assembly protein PilF
MLLRFANCELDIPNRRFRVAGAERKLEPQVFELLAVLAREPGRLMSREELVRSVWKGRIVSDSAIDARVAAARRAVGDDGRRQTIIETVPRLGVRFVAKVKVADSIKVPQAAGADSRYPRSIAVLPFEDLSEDGSQAYFADGVADDIITELCRYPDLTVIARHSSFAFRDCRDARAVGEALAVRFVLEGGVRRSGRRLRITVGLVDTRTGVRPWGESYTRDTVDVFSLQAEVARLVAGAVGANLHDVETARTIVADPETLDAHELALLAYARWSMLGREDIAAARDLALQAIELDPGYGRAYSTLAWTYVQDRFSGFAENPERWLEHAFDAASKAVALDRTDPFACVTLGMALLHMHQHARAVAELDRGITLSPSFSEVHAQKANVLGFMGRTEEAVASAETALRLNPRAPGYFHLMRGRGLLVGQRYADALAPLETAVSLMPKMPQIRVALAVAYSRLDRAKDARREIAAIRQAAPRFTCDYLRCTLPYRDSAILEDQIATLLKAGLPSN